MARSFNGSSDYLEYSGAVITGPPVTFACRIRPNVLAAATVVGLSNAVDAQYFALQPWSDGLVYATASGTGSGFATSAASYTTGAWLALMGVFASTTSRAVYINGGSKGTNTTSAVVTTPTLTTVGDGLRAGGRSEFANGDLAEAAIWSAALDDDEAVAYARGFSPALIRPGSLVHYWSIGGRNSPELDLRGLAPLTVTGTTYADHPRVIQRRKHRVYFGAGVAPPAPQIAVPIADILTTGWQAKGPALETVRNLLKRTESFANVPVDQWGWGSELTVTPDGTTDPNGGSTGAIFVEAGGVTIHELYYGFPETAVGDYAYAVDVAANVRSHVVLAMNGPHLFPFPQASFDVSAGAIDSNSNCNASITPLAHGYYRCAIWASGIQVAQVNLEPALDGVYTVTYSGSANALNIWGAQFEQASSPSAYQNPDNLPLAIVTTPIYPAIGETTRDPLTYAFVTAPGLPLKVAMTALSNPSVPTDPHVYAVWAYSPQSRSMSLDMYFGGVYVGTRTLTNTAVDAVHTVTLTAPEIALIPVGGYATPEAWVTGLV